MREIDLGFEGTENDKVWFDPANSTGKVTAGVIVMTLDSMIPPPSDPGIVAEVEASNLGLFEVGIFSIAAGVSQHVVVDVDV